MSEVNHSMKRIERDPETGVLRLVPDYQAAREYVRARRHAHIRHDPGGPTPEERELIIARRIRVACWTVIAFSWLTLAALAIRLTMPW